MLQAPLSRFFSWDRNWMLCICKKASWNRFLAARANCRWLDGGGYCAGVVLWRREDIAQEWCRGGDPAEAANELASREGAVATAIVLDVVGRQNGLMDRWFRMDRIQRQGAQTRRLKQRRAILKRDDAQRQSRVAELVARENKSPPEHQEHWQDRASPLQQQLMDATRDLAARRSKRRQRGEIVTALCGLLKSTGSVALLCNR